MRSTEPMRLLVIGTYRDSDLSRTHPLIAVLADLRREAGVERVSLHGLDDAAVEMLVAAAARHELDDALVALAHAIQRETEGNPFFIGEVMRHLAESRALFAAELARALGDGERLARVALASARPCGYLASANLVRRRRPAARAPPARARSAPPLAQAGRDPAGAPQRAVECTTKG